MKEIESARKPERTIHSLWVAVGVGVVEVEEGCTQEGIKEVHKIYWCTSSETAQHDDNHYHHHRDRFKRQKRT